MANIAQLVVLSCYYNPCRYATRWQNYNRFKSALKESGVTLLTLECAFGNQAFELPDALDTLKIRSSTPGFQSERLYNLLASWLPDECRYVAWVDTDILFTNPNWPSETIQALQECPVVQLFETCRRLNPPGSLEEESVVQSMAAVMQEHPERLNQGTVSTHGHTGYAWAMQRELFEEVGLYDAALAGCADLYLGHAIFNDYGYAIQASLAGSPRQLAHLRAWGDRLYAKAQGKLGVVSGELLHQWHGSYESRRYTEQIRRMSELGYNPQSDLIAPFARPMEWSSALGKPALPQLFNDYFWQRQEEGTP